MATELVRYEVNGRELALATEAAETHIANGADILTGTAQMVVGAIAVGNDNGARWFGTQSSQADLAGDSAVAFQVYKWEVILADIIDNIQMGVLGGQSYVLTLANGGLVMEFAG